MRGSIRLSAGLLSVGMLVGLAAGCSRSHPPSSSSSDSASVAVNQNRAEAGGPKAAAAPKAAPAPRAADVAVGPPADPALGRSVVRTGTLTVATKDVPGAVARAAAVVRAAGGYVSGQQAAVDPNDSRQDNATLTLKVPGSAYDSVLPALSRLGTLLTSEDRRDDVTGAVIDATSRLATEEASVARVRTLLSRARTIGEVVSVESELTTREADLESLKGRLAALKGQVSYATITMRLTTPSLAPRPPKATPAGFLGGLRTGWHSFAAVCVSALTAVGAALPFALTLALLAAAALAVRRRVLRRPSALPE